MADDANTAANLGVQQSPDETAIEPPVPQPTVSKHGVHQIDPTAASAFSSTAHDLTQTRRGRARQIKKELRDPKKFTEEVISWRIDQLLLRARPIYRHGQVGGNNLWSPSFGQGNSQEGFSMFDGFDLMWYVPTSFSSPFPDRLGEKVREDFLDRKAAIDRARESQQGTDFDNRVSLFVEKEAKSVWCGEWDADSDADKPSRSWEEMKSESEFTVLQMITMISKKRLLDGTALLPGYYGVNVVELSSCGKLFAHRRVIPGDANIEGIRARLEAWSPINSPVGQRTLSVARQKLDITMEYGTDLGRKKAALIKKELEKPSHNPCSEGWFWHFKLQVRDKYTLPAGKGPGRPKPVDGWTMLNDDEGLQLLKGGINGGKHAVFARLWTIHLRRLWPGLEELKDHLLSEDGEPQLTTDQLRVVDDLLEGQTAEEKENGQQLADMLAFLEGPTYRLEYARRRTGDCEIGFE
ncbi:hypothetical protein BGZ63DRAFT_446718 [Mariannaea sp. PMI_226]|nr:hypothetical protein BGZ63DRAFT_446718 [Mariannaea sp. PMI_226]